MSKHDKTILNILSGNADANLKFADVVSLLKFLGFEMRTKGSHHMFRKKGIRELINIQKDGSKLKPYQVRQIRAILTEYNLGKNGN